MTITNEVWRDIQGYEGLYEVSNLGRVKNKTGLIMKTQFCKSGYKRLTLTKYIKENGSKKKQMKTVNIHRLVGLAFINNPDNLECVNHLDENKNNNHVSNLQWCTRAENNNYASRENVCVGYGKPRPVRNLDTKEEFLSMNSAGKAYGVTAGAIYNCCTGLSNSSAGHEWEFVEEVQELQDSNKLQEYEVA